MTTAIIPARMGSQRLKKKNLQPFCGMPLIEYAIFRCKEAGVFDHIVVNSEDEEFSEIAKRNGVDFYKRDPELANNVATSEEFIADFFKNTTHDAVYQVHSITPLLTSDKIREFVSYTQNSGHDTVLSNVDDCIEVAFKGKPVNFSYEEKTNSQDLIPTQRITWSITFWKRETFLEAHRERRCGTYSGSIGYFSVPLYSGLAIKTLDDLKVAQTLRDNNVA